MGKTGLYCAQCGECRHQCLYGLDIPTAMRSYMYAHGYQNLAQAVRILKDIEIEEILCKRCNICPVTCTMRFDIPVKMREVLSWYLPRTLMI